MQICEPEEMKKVTGLSIPHTSHCLGSGDIMISAMGDENENPKGSLVAPLAINGSTRGVEHCVT